MRLFRLSVLWALTGAFLAIPRAEAVPFLVEMTLPDAVGGTRPPVVGDPWIPFTAPYIAIRVTGDTANVISRTESGARYEVTSLRIEVPGIGAGEVPWPTRSLSVSASGVISVLTTSYDTSFIGGATLRDAALQGYAMRESIGPVVVADSNTFQWGPQAAKITFQTDDGILGSVSTSHASGGTLKITIGGDTPNPITSTHYGDLGTFLLATGSNSVATFEEGTGDASGGVRFPGNALTVATTVPAFHFPSMVDEPHAYWFGSSGTPSRFALNTGSTVQAGLTAFTAEFPEDVVAAGFLYTCYTCNLTPLQYGFVWTTRNAAGDVVEKRTAAVSLALAPGDTQPEHGFFGLTTTRPFRSLTVEKYSPFAQSQPWMIDDVRYATKLASTPARLVEYHHVGFDHYFITADADEIARLDAGAFAGWSRTGLEFSAAGLGTPGTRPVCRFFGTSFGEKSSHFFTPDTDECAIVKANAHWQFEGNVFGMAQPSPLGECAAGTRPLYRLYNAGKGGAPNHRYTASPGARQLSANAGWIPEGNGMLGVIGCIPL